MTPEKSEGVSDTMTTEYLLEREVGHVLAALMPQNRLIVQLILHNGARIGDVLRLRTGVANLYASAPDLMTAGRSRTFSEDAGSATVIIEARDSQSGALLGRAVDGRLAGDTGPYLRNSVTNRSDFERLFEQWAKISINGLAELKAMSPIPGGS